MRSDIYIQPRFSLQAFPLNFPVDFLKRTSSEPEGANEIQPAFWHHAKPVMAISSVVPVSLAVSLPSPSNVHHPTFSDQKFPASDRVVFASIEASFGPGIQTSKLKSKAPALSQEAFPTIGALSESVYVGFAKESETSVIIPRDMRMA